jgi:hypothetical protein
MTRIVRKLGRAVIPIFCAVTAMVVPARALEATDLAIKAAFLFKFAFFVEWPPAAFASSDSPVNLCVVGDDPFGAVLDDAIKGQKIGDRAVTLRRMSSISRDSGCHIVFLSESAQSHLPQILAALKGSDVLTVTDATADGGDVGIINFVIKDNHVRFDVDDAAAASGGLVISSRLLSVALDVKSRR